MSNRLPSFSNANRELRKGVTEMWHEKKKPPTIKQMQDLAFGCGFWAAVFFLAWLLLMPVSQMSAFFALVGAFFYWHMWKWLNELGKFYRVYDGTIQARDVADELIRKDQDALAEKLYRGAIIPVQRLLNERDPDAVLLKRNLVMGKDVL